MSDLNGSGQTEITHRTSDYRPPRSFSNWLIRRPPRTADASQQAIGKGIGLAVFASDALSSTAHATQETLAISLLTGGVHEGTLQGLRYARLLSEDVTAVHVCIDPADAETVQKKWLIWGEDTR